MQTATVDEVLFRIDEHAAREPGGAVAFDGDGTLWSGDIGEDLFAAVLADGRIEPAAVEGLAREASAHGLSTEGTGRDLAHRIHAAYLEGKFPEERVCEIMTWICAGWTRAELDEFASEVCAAIGLEDRLHGEALAVVRGAQARGILVHIVSASPRAIVEQAARFVGVELARVSAAREAEEPSGRLGAAVEGPIPYGPGKVTHLRGRLGERPLYAAFGDNAFDAAMLRASRVPVAIRPKARLIERAPEIPGLLVLARA